MTILTRALAGVGVAALLAGGVAVASADPDTTVVQPPPIVVSTNVTPPPMTIELPPPVTATVTAPPLPPVTVTLPPPPPVTTTVTTTVTPTAPPAACGGPITITAGGTYSGCYQSSDANVPAVKISTTAPVTLSKARIIAKGIGISAWFDTNGGGARLTVTDSTFDQTDPGAVVRHRALQMFLPGSLVFTNNKLTDTDGVWLAGIDKKPVAMAGPLVFNNNLITNVGRYPHPLDTGCCVQALQLSSVLANGGQIWWNKITNAPGKSEVEDNISLYESGGADATHRIDVGYNLIDGAYPRALNNAGYTGGGINLGDGGGGSGAGIVGQHNTAHDNTVVSVTNYGISVNGLDNYATNNVLVNDGAEQRSDFGQAFIAWPQVAPSGIHADGTNKVNWHRFAGDTTQWPCYEPGGPYCAVTVVATTEQDARNAWEARRAGAGVAVGPRP